MIRLPFGIVPDGKALIAGERADDKIYLLLLDQHVRFVLSHVRRANCPFRIQLDRTARNFAAELADSKFDTSETVFAKEFKWPVQGCENSNS